MENSLPLPDIPPYAVLECPGGGAELAMPLPEGARRLCIAAARSFSRGDKRTAKDIFIKVLETSVSKKFAKKLRRYTVPELAGLAAFLLDAGSPQLSDTRGLPSDLALERAAHRLTGGTPPQQN